MKRAAAWSIAAAAAIWLSGCATTKPPPPAPPPPPLPPPLVIVTPPPPPPPVVKPAPVRTSCVPRNFPRSPRYPDTDQALREAGGAADRYQLLAAGRLMRAKRLAELERLVDGCR